MTTVSMILTMWREIIIYHRLMHDKTIFSKCKKNCNNHFVHEDVGADVFGRDWRLVLFYELFCE